MNIAEKIPQETLEQEITIAMNIKIHLCTTKLNLFNLDAT